MDAKVLVQEFSPYFNEEDIISLERFQIYIKLMMNGMTSLPFSAKILVPWMPGESICQKTPNMQKVIELSRAKYGTDREVVEGKINKWVETVFDKGMAIAQENKDKGILPGTPQALPQAIQLPGAPGQLNNVNETRDINESKNYKEDINVRQ
jgi:hypothetical protein